MVLSWAAPSGICTKVPTFANKAIATRRSDLEIVDGDMTLIESQLTIKNVPLAKNLRAASN